MKFSDLKIVNKSMLSKLSQLELESLSHQSGFVERVRKVTAIHLFVGFFVSNLLNSYSLANWSTQISLLFGVRISKQGIWKRLGMSHVLFVEQVLKRSISQDLGNAIDRLMVNKHQLFKDFNRVLVQDSTLIHLPDRFHRFFKGNYSKGKKKSLVKIQAMVNLKNNDLEYLELGDFSKNDQKASKDILSMLSKGDLIIRDLGYFVTDVLSAIQTNGAYYISKLRSGLCLYDTNEQEIQLHDLLANKDFLDLDLFMSRKKIPVRLIAIKLDQATAEARRRKARKNRDKRLNHSKEYYFLLGYQIYITNLSDQMLSVDQIARCYGLRWRIEIIFKAWKSHLNIDKLVHPNATDPYKIKILMIYALIMATIIQVHLYNYYWWTIYKAYGKFISLLKFTKFIADNLLLIISTNLCEQKLLIDILARACAYEKRRDRTNYMQSLIQCQG